MKRHIAVLILAVAAILFASCNTKSSEAPAAPVTLTCDAGYSCTQAGGVIFQWKVNGSNLDCKVKATTAGWVSVGFNTSGNCVMSGSNYIIGYVTGGSTASISDENGTGHNHSADSQQDVTNKAGTEAGGVTEITFTIPLNSGDGQDMALTQGGSYCVILAYGPGDDYTSMHSAFGSAAIIL